MSNLTYAPPYRGTFSEPFLELPVERLIALMRRSDATHLFTSGEWQRSLEITGKLDFYAAAAGAPYVSIGSGEFADIDDGDWDPPFYDFTCMVGFRVGSLQNAYICGVWPTTTEKSFVLEIDSSANFIARVTSDGSTIKTASLANAYAVDVWNFAALRFITGTQLLAYCNGEVAELTAAIPSNVKDSTAEFVIGGADVVPTTDFAGDICVCAVAASIVHQDHLDRLYYHMLRFTGA